MLKLFFNTTRVLKVARVPRAGFSTQGNNKPQPENQKDKYNDDKDDDFDDTDKKQENQEQEPEEEIPETPRRRLFRNIRRVIWWSGVGYFAYNYYHLVNSKDAYDRPDTNKYFLDAAKYVNNQKRSFIDFFTKPVVKKLLPDLPDLPFIDPPKTLVLNLSDTLIHSNYEFGKGRQIIKRPGLTELLNHLSQMYEIVILSDDDREFTMSIASKFDPYGQLIAARYGSESHVLDNNVYVKDLKYLNRDLRRVVVVEIDKERMKYQPENAIYIPKFDGNSEDKTLFELIPFLQYLANPEIKDIRTELERFGHEEPEKKYLEELRNRKQAMEKRGIGGIVRSMKKTQSPAAQYKPGQERY